MAQQQRSRSPHVALLPSAGMGHLIPVAELAKRLVLRHGFTATFITFSDFSSPAQTAYLDALPAGLSYVTLPSIPLDDLPADAQVETRLCVMVARSAPHVRAVLRELKQTTRLAAYVIDLFGGDTLEVARELGVPSYLFFTSTFMLFSLFLHLPELDAASTCEYRDLPEPVVLPGCVPVRGEDLVMPMQDRADDAYRWMLHIARRIREVDGVLGNTFVEMEPNTCEVLKKAEPSRPSVYPVGPLVRSSSGAGGEQNDACLKWLDSQPVGSVLLVSFGSGGVLSWEQTTELAGGLEMSGHRFIWVVRCPSDKGASGAFFGTEGSDDPLSYLPEGFLERTKDVGLAIPSWGPQVEVLRHEATAGFLSHCGWNSTLESVVHGVPMIAWPLYAEQRLNAVMLVEGVGAALRPKAGSDGVVRKEEVSKVVKELMEGEGGKRVKETVAVLQKAAAKAQEASDGSSYGALAEVAELWLRHGN